MRVSLTPGDTSYTVTGQFGSSFEVYFSTGWPTEVQYTIGTNTFTATFSNPVSPAPDNVLTYMVAGAQTSPGSGLTTLAGYLADVKRFLRARDNDQLYDDDDLKAFINRAMQQRDVDLGLNRSLVSFPFVMNQPRYTFAAIVAGGTVIDGNPAPNPIDVTSVVYTPWQNQPQGAGIRVPLGRKAYSWISPLLSISFPSLPRWYAVYGTRSVAVAVPPAGTYACEWDFYCYASALVNDTDADPVGYPWTDPVPFQACAFAKEQAQRYDEAKEWDAIYQTRLNRVRSRGRPYSVANPFSDQPGAFR